MAEAGELTRPSLPKGDWTWKVKGLGRPPGTAARLRDEVRGFAGRNKFGYGMVTSNAPN
jgi:hypothetical protein